VIVAGSALIRCMLNVNENALITIKATIKTETTFLILATSRPVGRRVYYDFWNKVLLANVS